MQPTTSLSKASGGSFLAQIIVKPLATKGRQQTPILFPLPVSVSRAPRSLLHPHNLPRGRLSQPHSHPDSVPQRLDGFVFLLRTCSFFLPWLLFYSHGSEAALSPRRQIRAGARSQRLQQQQAEEEHRGWRWRLAAAQSMCVREDCARLNPAGVWRRVAASNTATQRERKRVRESEREGEREKRGGGRGVSSLWTDAEDGTLPKSLGFIARIYLGKSRYTCLLWLRDLFWVGGAEFTRSRPNRLEPVKRSTLIHTHFPSCFLVSFMAQEPFPGSGCDNQLIRWRLKQQMDQLDEGGRN